MREIILLILITYTTYGVANTYLHRFKVLESGRKLLSKGNETAIVNRVCGLVKQHGWLMGLVQPTATVSNVRRWHVFDPNTRMVGLPSEFLSDKRTILAYPDGREVHHIQVAEESEHYEQFLGRTRQEPPAIVSVRDYYGYTEEEFIYTERPPSFIHNVFGDNGFSFEHFLAQVEPPLLNVASGGFHFSFLLSRLDLDRQKAKGISFELRRSVQVFNLDLSGYYRTFISNQWYLFGDFYDTGLPDNTFGATIALGGPLKKRTCSRDNCIHALRELERITAPQGRLLIEFSMPEKVMLSMLRESGVNFSHFTAYKGVERPAKGLRKKVGLLDIVLDKYSTSPRIYKVQQ